MRKTQSGFTLVEIAIVLVIIGLLLGGVLKGQELINSAKAKAAVNDFRNTLTMITAYQDRFRALPGDDPAPGAHLGENVAATAKNGTKGNGRIEGEWNSTSADDESVVMWQHLRLANLATGDVSKPGTNINAWVPTNSDGGRIGVSASKPSALGQNVRGPQYICQANINGRIAQQIDSTMDDGKPDAGSVGAFEDGATGGSAASPVTVYDDSKMYVVCYGF